MNQKKINIFLALIFTITFLVLIYFAANKWINREASQTNEQTISMQKNRTRKLKKKQKANSGRVLSSPGVINHASSIDKYLQKRHFTGNVLIADNGHIILEKGYGQANVKNNVPNDPHTLYLIASLEKALVATAILQLAQAGKLDINAPIGRYYANFPNGNKIKLKNLLAHTSGLSGLKQSIQKDWFTQTTPALLLQIMLNGINRQPGTWNYSDANYIVLANLVQKVSHQSLQKYLEVHVLLPSGIRDAGFGGENFYRLPQSAIGYAADGKQVVPLPNFNLLFGAGSVYMTAKDMYLFDQALLNGKLISPYSEHLMFTPQSTSHYGLRFYVLANRIFNNGFLGGFSTTNSFSRANSEYVILFSNKASNKKDNVITIRDSILSSLSNTH